MALKGAIDSFRQNMGETPWVKAGLVVMVLYSIYRVLQIGKRDKRMPPGPPTIPLLGNLHQIPVTGLYKKYAKPFVKSALLGKPANSQQDEGLG
jgi:hypothetical protein